MIAVLKCVGRTGALAACLWMLSEVVVSGQPAVVLSGRVVDATGLPLPAVGVELRTQDDGAAMTTTTDGRGDYRFVDVKPGAHVLSASLVDFGRSTRDVVVNPGAVMWVELVLRPSFQAGVVVSGLGTFNQLVDAGGAEEGLAAASRAASEGAVTARQLATRPIMRTGELLETVPGVVISQHSGEGKANQYYLRGFNLDHGTDLLTTVAGMPVNLPTHGHGHGYSDLNFVIPEIVSGVQYSKGPYFAEHGDFSAAGTATINYASAIEQPLLSLSAGGFGWRRLLVAASPRLGSGRLLVALEGNHHDGPWERGDDFRKLNGVVRYSRGNAFDGMALSVMGYDGRWNATDQVPRRAIESGEIGRFGFVDPAGGGRSHRYSGSIEAQRTRGNTAFRVNAYLIASGLNLFSNFTYFLDDPERGDQFEQVDRRVVSGAGVRMRRLGSWGGRTVEQTSGVQVRHDGIGDVALFRTADRIRLSTIRRDLVGQTSVGVHYDQEIRWTDTVRTIVGLRGDIYRFDVTSDRPQNSGRDVAALASPKAGVVLGPWKRTAIYANAGAGFHSNDARGAVMTIDPATGEPAERVTPLSPARGAEVGVRTVPRPGVQTSLTLWTLGLDSELLFVGDAGTTESTRPSRRSGIEWATYLRPTPQLTLDADVSLSRARFVDADPSGTFIPGAVNTVVSAGASYVHGRVTTSGRWRYFGPRPLIEDDSVRSDATSLVNARLAVAASRGLSVTLDVFNVLDSTASDVDYFYRSRLMGESEEGVEDVHLHPTPPRSLRVGISVRW